MSKRYFAAMIFLFCLYCISAHAVSFRYDLVIFTNNGLYNDDPGVDFYFLLSEDGGLPKFEFHNESTIDNVITQVYFDGSVLSGISIISQSSGVMFSAGASPSNLPAGNELTPSFSADFSAGAEPPPAFKGINNSLTEWLAITMNMPSGITFDDVRDALGTADLRVGVHLQGFGDDSSESAINDPREEIIPEPSVMSLLGLAGLGMLWRKKKK